MTDVIGLRLADAEVLLTKQGINWEIELTKSPKDSQRDSKQEAFRVVRQKKLSANKVLLTVVSDFIKGVNENGN